MVFAERIMEDESLGVEKLSFRDEMKHFHFIMKVVISKFARANLG